MPESQIETAKGNSTKALTRHIMEKFNLPLDKAFAKLSATEFYSLLNDTGTNLFLETNDYLCKACDFEHRTIAVVHPIFRAKAKYRSRRNA